jgi:hypothetical protein
MRLFQKLKFWNSLEYLYHFKHEVQQTARETGRSGQPALSARLDKTRFFVLD